MNKNIFKNTAILTVITLAAGILLGIVYEITKDPIQRTREQAKQEAYKVVMKEASEFEEYKEFDEKEAEKALKESCITGCYVNGASVARNKDGEEIGYVISTTSKEGYGGEIQISVGILSDGTVSGIEILSISETAGLGMEADEPEFKRQFKNVITEKFEVKKDNPAGNVDALSGATITTRAVTNAVNAGISYYHNVLAGGNVDGEV